MCNCLFCGQEMEAEENQENPHVCPPDKNISPAKKQDKKTNKGRRSMRRVFRNVEYENVERLLSDF